MQADVIKAHLNLYAVLGDLAELVRLDPMAAIIARDWDISIQFTVLGGPSAWLEFKQGVCRHGAGGYAGPTVWLSFATAGHLNQMFAGGKIPPIPLKGFQRLDFLKTEFPKLTERLEHFLKPSGVVLDEGDIETSTILMINTAMAAIPVLAKLEPVSRQITAATPFGTLELKIGETGPAFWIRFSESGVSHGKGDAAGPAARMGFRDLAVARQVITGAVDGFTAIGRGDVTISGLVPIIDNASLIMDRVEHYLA